MKIKTEVCEICRKEDCDGKIYKTEFMDDGKTVCQNDSSVGLHDGKLMYLFVRGYGESAWCDLEEVKKCQ